LSVKIAPYFCRCFASTKIELVSLPLGKSQVPPSAAKMDESKALARVDAWKEELAKMRLELETTTDMKKIVVLIKEIEEAEAVFRAAAIELGVEWDVRWGGCGLIACDCGM